MRRLTRRRRDDGVSVLFVALLFTALIGAVGLSVDVGNLTVQKARLQQGVDNAALAIAQDCARAPATCQSGAPGTATSLVAANADTTAGAPSIDTAARTATVTGGKDVPMPFAAYVGVGASKISASATATWDAHPREGYPVLPIGVGYCTWYHRQPPAGTLDGSQTMVRTDLLQAINNLAVDPVVTGLLSTLDGVTDLLGLPLTLSQLLPLDDILNSTLGTETTEEQCPAPDGYGTDDNRQLLTLKGGVWLTGVQSVLSPATSCRVATRIDLNMTLVAATGGLITPDCRKLLGTTVKKGDTVLLPVYVPRSNLSGALTRAGLGLYAGACVGGSGGTCLEVPPRLGIQIVGYAPFTITGWEFPSALPGPDDSVQCSGGLNVRVPLFTMLDRLFEPLLNRGGALDPRRVLYQSLFGRLGVIRVLLGNALDLPVRVLGCQGIKGHFTKTFTRDPNFQYSVDALDLGATNVKLIK